MTKQIHDFDSNQFMLKKVPECFDSNQVTTQKILQNFDSNLLMTQKTIWNIGSNQAMTQWFNCWFRWPFLGFLSISLTFLGALTKCRWLFWALIKFLDSNQLMTQAVSWRLESIQLMTQATFQELTQNQPMTQVDSPGIDSDWLMTQSASPFFDSNQLMTQAKIIWFWFDSWFDSESYPRLVKTMRTVNIQTQISRSILKRLGVFSLHSPELCWNEWLVTLVNPRTFAFRGIRLLPVNIVLTRSQGLHPHERYWGPVCVCGGRGGGRRSLLIRNISRIRTRGSHWKLSTIVIAIRKHFESDAESYQGQFEGRSLSFSPQ